ncbi:DUF4351 domain-containing protein [Methylomagnum sp.]
MRPSEPHAHSRFCHPTRAPADVERALSALIDWLKAPEQDPLRRAFTVWLKRVFLPGRLPGVEITNFHDLQEVQSMLAEQVVEWTQTWEQQGIEKGLARGRHEGEAAMLLRLLELRFGPLDDDIRQRIQMADAETLLRWGERILTATMPEAVVGD